MSRIRALFLSDMHLGSETSVLTAVDPETHGPDIERTSPVLSLLLECLKALLREEPGPDRPTLVLAGDILENALSTTNVAASVFEQFATGLCDGEALVVDDRILYVPGNHDHHLWETARERQYAAYVAGVPSGVPLWNTPWHATHLFVKQPGPGEGPVWNVESSLLTTLIRRASHLKDVEVQAVYPNLGLMSGDGSRCTVIHHGHYTEGIYELMTRVRAMAFPRQPKPEEIWDLEADNYAWIDFLWGTLGRSGRAGADVGRAYYILQDETATKTFVKHLASEIAGAIGHGAVMRWAEKQGIRLVIDWLVHHLGGLERQQPEGVLSPASQRMLATYLETFVKRQIERERRDQPLPQVSFVFGHTHKPYQRRQEFAGYAAPVDVYNTGGWVIDTVDTAPLQGGAVVVLDDAGHLASLRMYQQSDDPSSYRVRVEGVRVEGAGPEDAANPLVERLRAVVRPDESPWSDFSKLAAETVRDRHRNLSTVIADAVRASKPKS